MLLSLSLCVTVIAAGAPEEGISNFEATVVDGSVDVGPYYKWQAKEKQSIVKLIAARDEYRCFSIALRTSDKKAAIKYSITALKDKKGEIIPAENILLRQCKFSGRVSNTGHFLLPISNNVISLTKQNTKWLWGTIHIPKNCHPGIYKGGITFSCGTFKRTIPIKLCVNDIVLRDDNGSWGFFISTELADMKSPSYKYHVVGDLTSKTIFSYYAFWKRYKLNSPFL